MSNWLSLTIPQVWQELKLMLPANQKQLAYLAIKQEILERTLNALIEIEGISKDQIDKIAEKQRQEKLRGSNE